MSVTGMNAGDIILINNGTWYNIFLQKSLRKKSSVNATHVALSLGEGAFIHADTSCGVGFAYFPDLLVDSKGRWKVIRNKEINSDFEEKIEKAGIFHFNKTYNYGFLLKENEKSLFCSQLVDLVYKSVGVDIFGPNKTKSLLNLNNAFPVDFEELLIKDERWCEVSNVYQDNLNSGFIELQRTNFLMRQALIMSERNTRKFHSDMLDLVNTLNESHNLLPKEFKSTELETHLSEMITGLNESESAFFYNFWNIRSNKNRQVRS